MGWLGKIRLRFDYEEACWRAETIEDNCSTLEMKRARRFAWLFLLLRTLKLSLIDYFARVLARVAGLALESLVTLAVGAAGGFRKAA
jgi:hypothetical protein